MSKVETLTIQETESKILDTGLLYAINKLILHPAGMALSITTNDDAQTYLNVVRPEQGGAWSFSEDAELEGKKKLMAFLLGPHGQLPVEAFELLRELASS